MEENISRKCFRCKIPIEILKEKYIYEKHFYHFECFLQKEKNKKRDKLTEGEVLDKIKKLQAIEEERINNILIKDKLFKWIQSNYDITVLPNRFFIKMNSIFDGSHKGLSKKIPPEDMLDMWKRKKKELDDINNYNIKKGKNIIDFGRIQYDLAILLDKYDSYLRWKEKQKILESDLNKNKTNVNKIDYKSINTDNKLETETNINEILDEVF